MAAILVYDPLALAARHTRPLGYLQRGERVRLAGELPGPFHAQVLVLVHYSAPRFDASAAPSAKPAAYTVSRSAGASLRPSSTPCA